MASELEQGQKADALNEERPAHALNTARRLWEVAAGQRWRLVVSAISTVLYVVGTLAAVSYSALLVDRLWESIQATFAAGKTYTLTLDNGGREVLCYLGIWSLAWVFYATQTLVMASFAERLNLQLREHIADKLALLPHG